jgi:hypothetical protein
LVVDQIASGVPDVPLFQKGAATMITKECFGCEKVTSHEHLHATLSRAGKGKPQHPVEPFELQIRISFFRTFSGNVLGTRLTVTNGSRPYRPAHIKAMCC